MPQPKPALTSTDAFHMAANSKLPHGDPTVDSAMENLRVSLGLIARAIDEGVSAAFDLLTAREIDVVVEIANGGSVKEIAARLGLGTKTVETYRANLYRKLGVSTPTAITKFAILSGLSPLEVTPADPRNSEGQKPRPPTEGPDSV